MFDVFEGHFGKQRRDNRGQEVKTVKRAALILPLLLICLSTTDACVGKTLQIGAIDSTEGRVLSEILSLMINERTGATVTTSYYRNALELYQAVKAKQVDILIENTTRAMQILNKSADVDLKRTYETAKAIYEKDKGLIWFKPFGFLNGQGSAGQSYTAPLLKAEVLNNFPALPRVIGKLAGAIDDETYTKLIRSVEAGEKPKKVARDFLKSKKLI